MKKSIGWNPKRVLFGLSRIGYTPHTAIADIVDNSVTYGAKKVNILINKEKEEFSDTRKNNIKEYLVIDDGVGMNEDGVLKALELGSDDSNYDDLSLSKFGLGLKSASFSQGNVLQIVSSNDTSSGFVKYSVDLKKIEEEYFCEKLELNEEDSTLISTYLPNGIGTIIRISDVHTNNHPSLKTTTDQLLYRLGTIYYYFLSDGLELYLNNQKIDAYDVLFTEEANQHDNLNEHEWNGRTVNWISKSKKHTLDIDGNNSVLATIEVTQLPHPPTFSLDGDGEQKKIREKYKIESNNYGYYVYRNKRLISWASRLDGIIPQDQDFYSFRGRILLDSSADDSFNIDVKKSHLVLSEEAFNALSDLSDEYKRKSKKAWIHANNLKKSMMGKEPNNMSNDIAIKITLPDFLPSEDVPTPEEEKKRTARDEAYKKELKDKVRKEAEDQLKPEKEDEPLTDEDINAFITGSENENKKDKRIFRVLNIEDNLLWEPYYDDDVGHCVRINKTHRFSKLVFEDNSDNTDLQVLFEILLLHFSMAEAGLYRDINIDKKVAQGILADYKRTISDLLITTMRNQKIKLPPLN